MITFGEVSFAGAVKCGEDWADEQLGFLLSVEQRASFASCALLDIASYSRIPPNESLTAKISPLKFLPSSEERNSATTLLALKIVDSTH